MFFLLLIFIGQCSCLYRKYDFILKVDAENYEDYIESEKKPVVLHAYSPLSQDCKNVAGQFVKVAEELKDITKFACLQIDKQKELSYELGIKKPNSFYIVRRGQFQQFSGPITAKHIVGLVMNQVLSNLDAVEEVDFQYFFKNVMQLNDENFDEHIMKDDKPWMILLYSPKIPESKNMIPIWYDAAQKLVGEVNFASVDVTRNPTLAEEFDVAGYPTGVLLIREASFYLHYNVHVTSEFIKEWIENKMKEYDEEDQINELVSQERFEKCLEKALCLIAFVPHISSCHSKCRIDLLKTFNDLYEKYKDYKWGWLWCEESSQGYLERSLQIDVFNIPTVVALNSKKMKFTFLKSSFDRVGLEDFLQDILQMRIPSFNFKKNIRIHDTQLWNGQDSIKHNNLDYFDVDVKIKDEL